MSMFSLDIIRQPLLRNSLRLACDAVRAKFAIERTAKNKLVCKSVHLRQFSQFENRYSKILTGYFDELLQDVAGRLADNSQDTLSGESSVIAKQIFDVDHWSRRLFEISAPVLAVTMAEGVIAQQRLMGIDFKGTKFDKSAKSRTKETSASEFFDSLGAPEDVMGEWLGGVTVQGVTLGKIQTNLPLWFENEIYRRIYETVTMPYWIGITTTTLGDIEAVLSRGLVSGWSTQKIARHIRDGLISGGEKPDYAQVRAKNIARTEAGHALNGARTLAYDHLKQVLSKHDLADQIKRVWLSVLGLTTRDAHADLDGVPEDSEGLWVLGGIKCRWPSDVSLPPENRCNCQCTIVTEFGMSDDEARELISEYIQRVIEREAENRTPKKAFCPTGDGGGIDNSCPPNRRGASESQSISEKLVSEGIAKTADISFCHEDTQTAISDALEKSLSVGDHSLYLKSIKVVDKLPVSGDEGGLGYSSGSVYITKKFIDSAKRNDPDQVRESLRGTGGERNFLWQAGKTEAECVAFAVAHEVGHHVETSLFLDLGKGARDAGVSWTEHDAVQISGYASTHSVELFAEVHACVSLGKSEIVPSNILKWYHASLETADPSPIFVRTPKR